MDARLLRKRYDLVLAEAQFLRGRVRHLELELGALRPAAYKADVKIDLLNRANEKLGIENRQLRQKLDDLSKDLLSQNASLAAKSPALPSFVKANVPDRKKRSPGRRKGHAASHRPMPGQIDLHQTIGLGVDSTGVYCCPRCATQLSDVQNHQRLVEDLAEPKVVVTAYHTVSGYCPSCRRNQESRAREQPPASSLPQAQLGINALATAVYMRIGCRLPLRQISALFAATNTVRLSPGTIGSNPKSLLASNGTWAGIPSWPSENLHS